MKRELEHWGERLTPSQDARLWQEVRRGVHNRSGLPGPHEQDERAGLPRPALRRLRLVDRSVRFFPAAVTVGVLAAVFGWLLLSREPSAPPIWETAQTPGPDRSVTTEAAHAGAITLASAEAAHAGAITLASAEDSGAPGAAPRPPQPGQIRGFVRDSATGKALSPVNLLILDTPWGAMSQADGSFMVRNVPAGTYRIMAQMMGYEDEARDSVVVGPEDLVEVEFYLAPKIVTCLNAIRTVGHKKRIDKVWTSTSHAVVADNLASMPVDRVGEVISMQAGVIAKGGQLHFRGGRAGEVSYQIDGSPVSDPLAGGGLTQATGATRNPDSRPHPPQPGPAAVHVAGPSVTRQPAASRFPSGTGGQRPVNDQLADDMFFEHAGTNPFVDAAEDSLSTFGLDVDTGSYTITRRYLAEGCLPPPAAVRVEEFVNFFRKEYAPPTDGDFQIHIDGLCSPFSQVGAQNYRLLRVGIRGRVVRAENRTPAQIVLVIDTSGSMQAENRLELVKAALGILLGELRPDDEIGIVAYGNAAYTALPMTPVAEVEPIRSALALLIAQGSTNAEAGLGQGYEMMRRAARPDRIHRVILCSDGVANVGRTGPESILTQIRAEAETITLTTLGFGMGNYNDVLMERLADAGDGQYAYIDNLQEAVRVLRENLTGTLQTIARNAKAQVEFDPARVDRYRLLGYENRDVRDADFRNNKVDAGEIGAGHEVTALYELRLREDAAPGRIATVRLRYEQPERGSFVELERPVAAEQVAGDVAQAPPGLVLDVCVAEFAEILRQSYWARDSSPAAVLDLLRRLPEELRARPDAAEFIGLVERASALAH